MQLIVIGCMFILLPSCSDQKRNIPGHYKLEVHALPDLHIHDWLSYDISFQDSSKVLVYPKESDLFFYDLTEQKMRYQIKIPFRFTELNKFDVTDTSTFAFYADTMFFVKDKGLFTISPQFGDTHKILVKHGSFLHFPDLNLLVFEIIDYDATKKAYNNDFNFIGVCDYEGNFRTIPIKYPRFYGNGDLGQPLAYLTKHKQYVLASLNYESQIHTINLETDEIKTIALDAEEFDLETIPKAAEERTKKLNNWQKRNTYYEQYGPAFYDEESQSYSRIYFPRFPEKSEGVRYNSNLDKPVSIIRVDALANKKRYHLSSGRYFMKRLWWHHAGNFYYVKWNKLSNEKEYYQLDQLYLYHY